MSTAGPASSQLTTALARTPGISSATRPVTKGGLAYLEGTLTSAPDSQAAYISRQG